MKEGEMVLRGRRRRQVNVEVSTRHAQAREREREKRRKKGRERRWKSRASGGGSERMNNKEEGEENVLGRKKNASRETVDSQRGPKDEGEGSPYAAAVVDNRRVYLPALCVLC